ncbi:transmembrane protein 207 [Spea bombifrons]|uniref:transmembrane protein 207 n=1 Tax=Spea bombifrons TaxID=233779 RepID=UPI002349AE94|nr:transmembrane protein 207 [Spea bombifrons]
MTYTARNETIGRERDDVYSNKSSSVLAVPLILTALETIGFAIGKQPEQRTSNTQETNLPAVRSYLNRIFTLVIRMKTLRSFFLSPITGMVYLTLPQTACPSPCDLTEICVSYIEQPLNVWYVWVFLLIVAILVLRCMVACCIQCWVKRRTRFSSRHAVTVVTLSSSDLCVTESPMCHAWIPSPNNETLTSTVCLGGLESGAPPSYEELFSTRKF